ncbi:hypothetical protein [Amycolatopsis sp. NPDC021455]|uniref:hypothetical protein n=1 Tax=Amycolatopsis sp. NPDC021455 TaxID=3154901 RepID=UPI0033E02FAD
MTLPGVGSLADQINELRKQLAEMKRTPGPGPAYAQARMTQDVPLSTGDNFVTHWALNADSVQARPGVLDDLGWVDEFSVPPRFVIQADGYYSIHYHATVKNAGASDSLAIHVHQDPASVSPSIAAATAKNSGAPEGTTLDAVNPRIPLYQGDYLYWSVYTSGTGTLVQQSLGVYSLITLQYISAI